MYEKRFKFKSIVICLVLVIFAGGVFFLVEKIKSGKNGRTFALSDEIENPNEEDPASAAEGQSRDFFVSGWLPYWAKNEGVQSLQGKMKSFSQIDIFAFGVDGQGNLVDTAKIGQAPWARLRDQAKKENVDIQPTILWGDAAAMRKIFSDSKLRENHADKIIAMLEKNDFSGVDIDYEGKDVADKDDFSLFLKILHEKLKTSGSKTLNCTVEARTQDEPPAGFTGTRAMSWANDFSVLNENCDSVTIMAYDQVFQIHRSKTFEAADQTPSAPNADNRWVEENVNYALQYVAPEKLILGVSTYGWEFSAQKISGGYRYAKIRSISYLEAKAQAEAAKATMARTEGGELSYIYQTADGLHVVTVDDTWSVAEKIAIAKKYGLKGVSLFKLDGASDQKIFDVLGEISSARDK